MKNKKGFTLAELLAVIAVLAIILVIAIPQIMNIIKSSRLKSFETAARIIARKAEDEAMDSKMLKENRTLKCEDIASMTDDYLYCNIIYEDGNIKVLLNGRTNSKFSNMYCVGTKDNMNCNEGMLAVAYIKEQAEKNLDGLIIDEYGDIRYQGTNSVVKNYVTFNNETWRIIGVFNIEGEDRVKLVRHSSIGSFAWDSSDSSINSGYGTGDWSKSKLMYELNGDYLNTELTENPKWYNGRNNKKTAVFDKSKVLKSEAQQLIDDAIWYIGGSPSGSSLEKQYNNERKKTCIAKVGLISPSDFGYASGNENCKLKINDNCNQNWSPVRGWTLIPYGTQNSLRVTESWCSHYASIQPFAVHPSVYLKTDVVITGLGTNDANKFKFSL